MIHLLPIEPIEERYSADWLRWWPPALRARGLEVQVHTGRRLLGSGRGEAIRRGQFLDAIDTHFYKATQLANFAHAVQASEVHDGDTVLLLDGWNPAVTALAYMRQVAQVPFRIALVLHAGTWDPNDHLARCGLTPWARWDEVAWLSAADVALVATEYHRRLIVDHVRRTVAGTADGEATVDRVERIIAVTGFPLELDELSRYDVPWEARERLVVFPHRIAPEKAPWEFDFLQDLYANEFPDDHVRWVRTQDGYTDKAAFYALLGQARVAFSSAAQETWGIAQLEAWFLGATPVVPRRLSYAELYQPEHQYADVRRAVDLVRIALDGDRVPFAPLRDPRAAWDAIAAALVEG